MDYRIEENISFRLLSMAETIFVNDITIPFFWDKCIKNGMIDELRSYSSSAENTIFGFADGTSFNGESYQYYIGTPYEGENIPSGYMLKEIPPNTWAVFRCINLSDRSVNLELFKKIFSEFFPTSDYKPKDFQLEAFPGDGSESGDTVCEIWIAVEKKQRNNS